MVDDIFGLCYTYPVLMGINVKGVGINMGTKEKLLELFESNKGFYFSGEEIAGRLGVSRTAVWKAVKTLQSEGYSINAVSNKGYCLSVETDILSAQGIKKYLEPICEGVRVEVLPEVSSTNTEVRKKATAGEPEGYVLVAGQQTEGRGRIGRRFFSPLDTGIYMSLLLRPENYSSQKAVRLTTMAAVAACEAIEAVVAAGETGGTEKTGRTEETVTAEEETGRIEETVMAEEEAGRTEETVTSVEEICGKKTVATAGKAVKKKALIKWVNDIYIEGRKVSGILTEASFGLENGLLEYAVLGIGINVYEPEGGFPSEIEDIAKAVFDTAQNDGKNHLAAEFLNHFMRYYRAGEQADYVQEYRKRSLVIGRKIQVIANGTVKNAVACGIDDDCRLLVRYEDGSEESLSSGEISVRLNEVGDEILQSV